MNMINFLIAIWNDWYTIVVFNDTLVITITEKTGFSLFDLPDLDFNCRYKFKYNLNFNNYFNFIYNLLSCNGKLYNTLEGVNFKPPITVLRENTYFWAISYLYDPLLHIGQIRYNFAIPSFLHPYHLPLFLGLLVMVSNYLLNSISNLLNSITSLFSRYIKFLKYIYKKISVMVSNNKIKIINHSKIKIKLSRICAKVSELPKNDLSKILDYTGNHSIPDHLRNFTVNMEGSFLYNPDEAGTFEPVYDTVDRIVAIHQENSMIMEDLVYELELYLAHHNLTITDYTNNIVGFLQGNVSENQRRRVTSLLNRLFDAITVTTDNHRRLLNLYRIGNQSLLDYLNRSYDLYNTSLNRASRAITRLNNLARCFNF